MNSLRTLAPAVRTALLVAFGALAGRPAAAAALSTPNDATVVSLSVVPAAGRADVVVRVDGSVTLKHFTLSKPDKIVVDLTGATLGLPAGDSYDGVARGGITRVRYSQFTKTVVRIVLTLDAPHAYDVTQEDGEVHVRVDGAAEKFAPWTVGAAAAGDATDARDVHDAHDAHEAARVMPRESAASFENVAARHPASSAQRSTSDAEHDLAARPTQTAQQRSQEPCITANFEANTIADVLAAFSAFTGRTILPSKNVSGTITANIICQPWDVALKAIMNANGYDVTVNPQGIIIVDTFENIASRQQTTQALIPLNTRNVRLNYARANSVAQAVTVRLTRTCPTVQTVSQQAPPLTAQNLPNGPIQPTAGQPTAMQVQQQPQVGVMMNLQCPTRGAVTADTITNSISITDVPSALDDLEAYAHSLDVRQPQVNIKAKIILVDRSTLEGLGLRYDLGSQQQFFNDIVPRLDSAGNPLTTAGQILLGGNTVSAIANATARVPGAALQLVYSTAMGNFDFTTFLEALQTNTLLDVQAEPSATVLNNRTASLVAGTTVPVRIIDAGSAAGNTSNAPRATVQMQQVGIILTVTPQITNNRQIQMRVHVENSDVQFQTSDVGAVFPTQKVDNEMLVADGETMVVGGLTQTTVNVTRTGLPILVDLPIIGHLFGVTNRTETKRDLLILITPHIIDEGQAFDTGHP
ncbi:MAG TPA: AMIN domain-containing protein [Gemmatimonadaceae bacterium]|nr:AMIN domain-containing protein [Gemmatimonadaceae bacterium]